MSDILLTEYFVNPLRQTRCIHVEIFIGIVLANPRCFLEIFRKWISEKLECCHPGFD